MNGTTSRAVLASAYFFCDSRQTPMFNWVSRAQFRGCDRRHLSVGVDRRVEFAFVLMPSRCRSEPRPPTDSAGIGLRPARAPAGWRPTAFAVRASWPRRSSARSVRAGTFWNRPIAETSSAALLGSGVILQLHHHLAQPVDCLARLGLFSLPAMAWKVACAALVSPLAA